MLKGVKWQKIETEEAAEKYDVGTASNDSVDLDDLGDPPEEFLVFKGNVKLSGAHSYGETVKEDPDTFTVCVIDGDLEVDGPFTFHSSDVYNVLYVTGSMTVKSLVCEWDCHMFVGKSLAVKDTLLTNLTDAGHLVVQGSLTAEAWIECMGRGCIEFGKKPKVRYIRDENADEDEDAPKAQSAQKVLLPAFFEDGELDSEKLATAIQKGKPIFR